MAEPFLAGIPYGFGIPGAPWPGTGPGIFVWETQGYFPTGTYVPMRTEFLLDSVPATRVLPNGVKIRKFQTYATPNVYPREAWTWAVRKNRAHVEAWDLGYLKDGTAGLYVIVMDENPNPNSVQLWTAQGIVERLSATTYPEYGRSYAQYSAEIERLTDYQFVSYITISV